jgi:hypothetical protein
MFLRASARPAEHQQRHYRADTGQDDAGREGRLEALLNDEPPSDSDTAVTDVIGRRG